MTQEEKELLKDLSARWLYGTIVSVTDGTIKYNAYIESVSHKSIQVSPVSDSNFTAYTFYKISEIKPYLRPLSAMTEEELIELNCLCYHNISIQYNMLCGYICCGELEDVFDYLNSIHVDYRGLISKGLALEAPEDMYKFE